MWLLELELREVFCVAVVARVSDEVWLLVAARGVLVRAYKIVVLIMQSCVQTTPSLHEAAGYGLDTRLFIV